MLNDPTPSPGPKGTFTSNETSSQRITRFEQLASEFAKRVRQGKPVTIEQYAANHPAMADKIRELFPVILAMEHSKLEREAASLHRQIPEELHLERLGDCRIVREIGRGGMGVVFEA